MSPAVPSGDVSQGCKLRRVACRRRLLSGHCEPVYAPGVGARPGRVRHCCFEHAGQIFGFLDRRPRQPVL